MSARIKDRQANNMMDALLFAKEHGTPLNSHLIIHWGGTMAGDDPDGKLFARFRERLNKRLQRLGLPYGLICIWVRERHRNSRTNCLSEVEHCHMLFHLPKRYQRSPYWEKIVSIVEELVDLVGNGNLDDRTVKLTFPANPDGKYFLKGASERIWDSYGLPEKWRSRRGEGRTTQNIGPKARNRASNLNDDG